jgi:hypothetical protein
MTVSSPPARSPTPASGQPAGRKLPQIRRIAPGVRSTRMVLNAVEGYGKTTFGAYAPEPIILMARGETGYETLREKDLVPDADSVFLESWPDTLDFVASLADTKHQSVVFDAAGGFERLCHEFVCRRDFNNDWGEKGFGSFQKGYEVSVPEWLKLLQALDRIRATRDLNVIILSHAKAKTFKNPLGPDFDRYTTDCHEKTWSVTHKWADVVLFGTFVSVTQEKKGRVKGIGGTERVIYCQRTDGFDAKNRYGMPEQLSVGEPSTVFASVWNAITGSVKAGAGDDAPPM